MVSLCGSSSGEGASANPGDGPGSASPISGHFAKAPSDELLAYMESCHKGSWHSTLNNHASTRPKKYGGPTVPSVQNCKTFTEPGAASTTWQCVLDLPNSFTKNDGIRLRVSCEAPTKTQVDEDVCRLAFTYLLMESPEQVILRPRHWNVSIEGLLMNIPDYLSLFLRSTAPGSASACQRESHAHGWRSCWGAVVSCVGRSRRRASAGYPPYSWRLFRSLSHLSQMDGSWT